jgi:hypothetical protein
MRIAQRQETSSGPTRGAALATTSALHAEYPSAPMTQSASPTEKKKVAVVIAALTEGPYKVELWGLDSNAAYVRSGITKNLFTDARGDPILFARLDAEKVARLYNEDHALK